MEFSSLGALAQHLVAQTANDLKLTQSGLERAARLIENTAKSEFGTYQPGIGPFGAWDDLAQSTQDDRSRQGYGPNDPLLRDGMLRDSIQHEVGEWEAIIGSTSEIMPFHEFGTSKMPPRPVLGPALYRRADQAAKLIGLYAFSGLVGYDPAGTGHYGPRAVSDMDDIHELLGYNVDGGENRIGEIHVGHGLD